MCDFFNKGVLNGWLLIKERVVYEYNYSIFLKENDSSKVRRREYIALYIYIKKIYK